MKVSKQALEVILVGIMTCILVVTAIMLLRESIVVQDNNWSGAYPLITTTPTPTIFPNQGWWTSLPTAPGLGGIATPIVTPIHKP